VLRLSAIACATAAKWRAGEPQEARIYRGGTDDCAEEAQKLVRVGQPLRAWTAVTQELALDFGAP